MTEEEKKAHEIVVSYWSKLDCSNEWLTAYNCGLIHVDGIIDALKQVCDDPIWFAYWAKVRACIDGFKNRI